MTDIFCEVKSCLHCIEGICRKDVITIKEKYFESQSIVWTESVCDDFKESR